MLASAKIFKEEFKLKRLTDVNIKTTAQVEGLLSEGNLRERMLALGFTQGALIDVLRKGPKNHLTVYKVRGIKIALRKEESNLILVK